MNTIFGRWSIADSAVARKAVLSVAGLAFVGGALAAPAVATAQAPAPAPAMTTVASESSDKPGMDKLEPHGAQGDQSQVSLSDEQKANADAIVAATKKAGLDERAAVIAVATSLQESKLNNYGHLGDLNDHDSLGLFQQRPSSGWGTADQVTDPEHATTSFLDALKQVDGWHDMALTDAAQAVQVSAYPDAYAQWEDQAAHLVQDAWAK